VNDTVQPIEVKKRFITSIGFIITCFIVC